MNKINLNDYGVVELTPIEKNNIDGGSFAVLLFFFILGVALGYGEATEAGY